ncbi:FAD-dependent oxidoreductase domain-containing protein 2 [Latimeria chalumnae]|uniref:FAD-dependent oxidoreductase domain-containing protein 2 n=1 Tax=Latimeria chalumnae TaxID=7897 RepID=UPI00313F05D6
MERQGLRNREPPQGRRSSPDVTRTSSFRRWLCAFLVDLAVVCQTGGSVLPSHHDYCIIGAGPSGLQMAHFLQRSQRDYVVLEQSAGPGHFFRHYPRHRRLISINKRHTGRRNAEFNLRHDWNSLLSHEEGLLFRHYSPDFFPHADAMVRYLGDFARELGLRVRYGTRVTHVRRQRDPLAWHGHHFLLTDQRHRRYHCRVLLVATGLGVPNVVDFLGSQYVEGYESVSVDPNDFLGQTVLILGKGNSAFETAENILGTANFIHMISRSRVRLSWATHYVGDIRAINHGLLDTYQLKSLDGVLERDLEDIAVLRDQSGRLHVTLALPDNATQVPPLLEDELDNFSMREPYDRIIRCLGWKFNFSIFHNSTALVPCKGKKRRFPLIKPSYESEHTPGLFVLGAASHSIDYRQSAGGFIHGFRYTARAVHRLLEQRYHSVPWPANVLPITQLTSAIIRRVNEASGLYQMFSVLGDIVLLRENATEFEYLEEYPIGALPDLERITGRRQEDGLFVITLEYGKNFSGPEKDVFYPDRSVGYPEHAWQCNFLHPVIYYYKSLPTERDMRYRPKKWPLPRPDAIHHIVEDFLTDWTTPISHVLPLRRFLEGCLDTDLRSFFAESCFLLALTSRKVPPFCKQGYLHMQGLVGNAGLQRHAVEAGLMEDFTTTDTEEENGSCQSHDLPEGHMLRMDDSLRPHTSHRDEL